MYSQSIKNQGSSMIQSPIPEQGQIVTVRQRRYVVTEVQKSTLPISPLAIKLETGQHLVSLNCIEDDALGETLQVIWEIEPGTSIEERINLPYPVGFDTPDRLDAFLMQCAGGRFRQRIFDLCKPHFEAGLISKITSLIHWCVPSKCRAPIC